MKSFVLVFGLLLLIAIEILRVYFIMPFPGSQKDETIDIAYWLDKNIMWVRLVLLAIIAYPVVYVFRRSKVWRKLLLTLGIVLYVIVFYLFNFRFLAEKMFYQPRNRSFATAANNKVSIDKLVLGLVINDEARAYPIQLIGYHHQVRDTVGSMPVMVTYCTVCRTGRVFSPGLNNRETFRLVGMDHFNAMFEDRSTKSWWRQATGEAVAGPMKGWKLDQWPTQQMTLAAWLRKYPASLILQPDSAFQKDYDDLAEFDKGTVKSSLEKRDSASWKPKSWVIGIEYNDQSKAYDWNELVSKRIINDSLANLPLLIVLEKDSASYHVWDRSVNGTVMQFAKPDEKDLMKDITTGSTWNMDGVCLEGPMLGWQLLPVPASQEFWHSWQTFHKRTLR